RVQPKRTLEIEFPSATGIACRESTAEGVERGKRRVATGSGTRLRRRVEYRSTRVRRNRSACCHDGWPVVVHDFSTSSCVAGCGRERECRRSPARYDAGGEPAIR